MVDSFKSAPLENSNTLGIYKATTETTFEREVTCLSDYLMTSFSTNFVFFFLTLRCHLQKNTKKLPETESYVTQANFKITLLPLLLKC